MKAFYKFVQGDMCYDVSAGGEGRLLKREGGGGREVGRG